MATRIAKGAGNQSPQPFRDSIDALMAPIEIPLNIVVKIATVLYLKPARLLFSCMFQ
jgi:hypothetical protein